MTSTTQRARARRHDAPTAILAWATDRATGVGRHITEIQRGLACDCICPSCGHRLEAINPQKKVFRKGEKRPFFRHYRGQERSGCLVAASRVALQRALLAAEGVFELPGRRVEVPVLGLSGTSYSGIAEAMPERAFVRELFFTDEVLALLVLEGGRKVHVAARASFSGLSGAESVIVVDCDAADIAGMSIEQLRSRLFLSTDGKAWLCSSDDRALSEAAQTAAEGQARDWLDFWDGSDLDVPLDWQRESVLHRAVKEIIAHEGRLLLPEQSVHVERRESGISKRRTWRSPPREVRFDSVELEVRLGRVIPDIVARIGEYELLIEVTVSHPISDLKADVFTALGFPVLEIDLRRASGRVSRAELRDIVMGGLELKRWVFHPRIENRRAQLLSLVLDDIATERAALQAPLAERLAQASDTAEPEASRALSAVPSPLRSAKTTAAQYLAAKGRDVPDGLRDRMPSPPTEDALERMMLHGAALDQWKRAHPEAWEDFVASESQRRRGQGAGGDDDGASKGG